MTEGFGVVGLGQMGKGLAVSLNRVGRAVVGYDTRRLLPPLAPAIVIASSLDDVASTCTTVLLALPNGPAVRSVVEVLLERVAPGTLLIDCSTVDPAETIALADLAATRDIRFRDAGMAGGGRQQATDGTLTFLVGCPFAEWDELTAVLAPIARDVIRCGDTGAGVTTKVINNLLALTIYLADVEALVVARSAGLDVNIVRQVFAGTVAANSALDVLVGAQLLPRTFEGAFRTSLAHKDATLGVGLGERLHVPLRIMAATPSLLREAIEQGYGDRGVGAAGLVIESAANVSLIDDPA